MKISRGKTESILIALILMSSMIASLVVLPNVNAHTPPYNVPTTAYVTLSPSTVGIGQYATIVVWVDRYSPTAGGGQGQRWDGFKIDITKPDGTKETIGPFKCGSDVGSDYRTYIPDQLGTYTIVFSWPGEVATAMPGLPSTSAWINDTYLGATSDPAYLTVQQEPIKGYQEPPLPTDYWTRPITDINRGWSMLASSWLKGTWLDNNFQRAGTAPESPHVMWTRPLTPARAGGINDAQWPGIPSNVNDYESPWSAPIIMNGKIYYNSPQVSDSVKYGYYCVDLATGEQIWYKNGTDNGVHYDVPIPGGYDQTQYSRGGNSIAGTGMLTQGQLYSYYSVNGAGILSYLIMEDGTTWYFLDAATGNWMLTLINVPPGTEAMDQNGDILLYTYNPNTGNILCWNSSQSIPPPNPLGTTQQQWKMRFGATIDAVNDTSWTVVGPTSTVPRAAIEPRSGYTMNVTAEAHLPSSAAFGAVASGFNYVLEDAHRVPKELMGFYKGPGSSIGFDPDPDFFAAWVLAINEHATTNSPHPEFTNTQNTNLGFTVTTVFNKNIQVPLPGKNYTWNIIGASYEDQVFAITCKQTEQIWGYSLKDGSLLWGPTPARFNPIDYYGVSGAFYYGMYLSVGYGGTLYAYDAKTGTLLWNYNDTAPYYESPYGSYFPLSISAVCDGKVYLHSTEHSPTKPLWRPWLICVNATDGKELWKILDFNMGLSIADGYIVTGNLFDNNIYCIGKGPSATTVDAPMTGVTVGSPVVIRGTVTDISPGTQQLALASKYPNGVPAIADGNMEAWMEYLYEQQALPTSASGVTVSLDAVDPNGNFIHMGDATSDLTGKFSFAWTPPDVTGKYMVIAGFTGSKSYYASTDETAMYVQAPVATASPPPTQGAAPDTTLTIVGMGIAIIIAIAIVGVLMLRKHP